MAILGRLVIGPVVRTLTTGLGNGVQWLIDQLLLTSSPTTCPHGRPVILRLTMKDIERGFHRI